MNMNFERKSSFNNAIVLIIVLFQLASVPAWSASDNLPLTSDLIKARLNEVGTSVEAKETGVLLSYLNRHMNVRYKDYTEAMLGRRVMYFPLFEAALKQKNLPVDLMYLSIVESSLRPTAKSPVGAVGLWQIMPGTAKLLGLRINEFVDERCDPIKSTEAAVKHLFNLNQVYKDWALALAAYNSGAGNVNVAIRKTNSRDFWTIKPFLPRETRDYVPAFLAASYLVNYHREHDVEALMPSLDYQITGTVKIYQQTTFADLAAWTGLEEKTIQELNPAFKRRVIPTSVNGYDIILPRRVLDQVQSHLYAPDRPATLPLNIDDQKGEYVTLDYFPSRSESIKDIAEHFNLNDYNIKYWNHLHPNEETVSQKLTLHVFEKHSERIKAVEKAVLRKVIVAKKIPSLTAAQFKHNISLVSPDISHLSQIKAQNILSLPNRRKYMLRRGETLAEVAGKFEGLTLEKLMRLNNIQDPSQLKAGITLMVE